MRYALLIYADEPAVTALMDEQAVGEFVALGRELRARGGLEAVARLDEVATATTVRLRGGKVLVTDGPFAETKEQFGGLSIAHFDSREAAVAHAARIPTARVGAIEVRPVMEWPPDADPSDAL